MKIQMQGQSLRVRISERELAQLQAGEVIVNQTHLPGGVRCRQEVRLVDVATPSFGWAVDGWCLYLPPGLVASYVARLPCRDGIGFALSVEEQGELQVVFEVDVRDSVRSRGTRKQENQAGGHPDRGAG